jgi:hypothetical protein
MTGRKQVLEADPELYQLLLIRKRPLLAEEKESGFSAQSRFKSARAVEYTEGAVVGAEAEERRDCCGGVVVKVEGVWGGGV